MVLYQVGDDGAEPGADDWQCVREERSVQAGARGGAGQCGRGGRGGRDGRGRRARGRRGLGQAPRAARARHHARWQRLLWHRRRPLHLRIQRIFIVRSVVTGPCIHYHFHYLLLAVIV